jgi:hypothetical protein
MNAKQAARLASLLPGGKPKYIRCYDSGDSFADRYTVVYTKAGDGRCYYVGMNCAPFHPQGIGMHGESDTMIDRPTYGHLGKRIAFDYLPEDCQKLVLQDYKEMWKLA